MKIGASDYDGTLFRQQTIAREDVEGIRQWRAAGNKFGVVSGRDYGMMMPQLNHYGIESDYAVCNNGAIIFRADGIPLWAGDIQRIHCRYSQNCDPGKSRNGLCKCGSNACRSSLSKTNGAAARHITCNSPVFDDEAAEFTPRRLRHH